MKLNRPLYFAADLRVIEQQESGTVLMERAGAAIAESVQNVLPQVQSTVLVLAGPGNNGGDAFVAARLLQNIYQVSVVFFGKVDHLPPDAAEAYHRWVKSGGEVLSVIPESSWDLVLDGLLGIGLNKPVSGALAEIIQQVNAMGTQVLAIDIPSGLCANTGRVLGQAIRADWTITLLGLKPGLFTHDGPDHTGDVLPDLLGVRSEHPASGFLIEHEDVSKLLLRRRKNSNKGDYGNLVVIGGAANMTGAGLLAARAGLMLGSGRVYLGLLDTSAATLDPVMPELMLRPVDACLAVSPCACLVIGPGMGVEQQAKGLLQKALGVESPLVLDADALNMLAEQPNFAPIVRQRNAVTVMTPHPGEAARLLLCSVSDIQQDRIASACRMSQQFNAIVVLKGCGSVIAFPDGRWFINHSGNPGLASAGMGDVLAGMIGALIAQHMSVEEAVLLAVHLHGAAADGLVERGSGPVGLSASEVMTEARWLLNQWIYL